MNLKLFFTLFPKGYWISIGAGIILHLIGGQAEVPGNILINFGLFIVIFRLAVIVHEAGHLIAARLVRGVPRRMVLGTGHEVYRTKTLGISVIVNSRLAGAYAGAWLHDSKFVRLRYAFFILGGVLLNGLVALMFYGLLGFGIYDSQGQISVDVPSIVILANSIMANQFRILTDSRHKVGQSISGIPGSDHSRNGGSNWSGIFRGTNREAQRRQKPPMEFRSLLRSEPHNNFFCYF